MKRIASFCVDHTRLPRGMYTSRVDGDVITYDIRMKVPNKGDYLENGTLHTLEHLFATYARNSSDGEKVIYVGPMGCRTGFYLLVRDTLSPSDAIRLVQESFAFIASYEGEIPGAREEECGNYREQNLPGARHEAAAMLSVLKEWKADQLNYPAYL
ncbi:S-ribosylhomocysteine lyase [uncultured Ruthenibacterium sp.]|uniref:S-ribosylhomocysteine lyase n=1 Tax=uncultured Ruthenibacterium sp. TaxID=1905347 RepID=UPI00349EE840